MANKYCNLDGSKKIKDEYQKINIGFDKVEEDVNKINDDINALDERVDEIITTPVEDVSAEEIIDARGGNPTLGKRFENIETAIEELDGEDIKYDNTESGLSAENVQTAIDEVKDELDEHKADYAKEATEFTIESDDIYERVNCNYYKKNGFVFLNLGLIQKKNASAFALGEHITRLPVGFRPKQTVYVQGISQTGTVRKSISLIVYSTGEVQMGQSSTDNYIRLSVTYYAGGGTV